MNGPWHYTEAERLLAEATEALDASPEDESPLVLRALVHATLAAAAASTVCAFSSEDEPELWAQAFADTGAVETPEQSAAIVDANLARMGVTLGGERYRGPCHDPQCGDSTWDHECPLPPGDYRVTNGITHEADR